ncbi:hypothetical protein LIER_28471 [Lithospermum erythrorhizon]|uniref:Uncharacterized protein n=1 Tax=Lithospermum erythrorhizon TaxID=34254 RepID=A0AAV3RFU1_LITER
MAKMSAKLLVVLLVAISCVMLTESRSVLEKQDEKPSGPNCWDITSSDTKSCSTGCTYVPTTDMDGVCMPSHIIHDVSTECHIHADCFDLDPDSYCVRIIDAPYGLCSRSLKF